jgi:cellulose synthase/poly-beta-1,6-N-acetylglucosamine synthase-like glycosyltransferase
MLYIELIAIFFVYVFVLIQVTLCITLVNYEEKQKKKYFTDDELDNLPFVSILIPARNEAHQIHRCIESLFELNYPQNKFEVLIGDDSSTDNTAELVQNLIQSRTNFKLISITQNLGKARAKANVLANLAHKAKGEIFAVTDADIAVKPDWLRTLVNEFNNPNIAIVSGTTIVKGETLFERMQGLEWLYFSGLLIAFDKLGLKGTAVGNNMAYKKEAYFKLGGYENIDFSVTEDFKLFDTFRKAGYQTKNTINIESLNFSNAQTQYKHFLHQRKRWLIGAKELNSVWKFIFVVFGSFYAMVFILALFSLQSALVMWAIKFSLQSFVIILLNNRFKIKTRYPDLLVLEPYYLISSSAVLAFYFSAKKMDWKNRNY